jgi:hypothetical protein
MPVEDIVKNSSIKHHPSENISIQLNRLLHRIDCKATLIEIATEHGCRLNRIRRSKNWLLTGKQSQLAEMSKQLREPKTVWIIETIDKALPKPTFNLIEVLKSSPAMTVNQLIADTGCTITEARSAIDSAEGFGA